MLPEWNLGASEELDRSDAGNGIQVGVRYLRMVILYLVQEVLNYGQASIVGIARLLGEAL